jgi:hypothetical protein
LGQRLLGQWLLVQGLFEHRLQQGHQLQVEQLLVLVQLVQAQGNIIAHFSKPFGGCMVF